MFIRLRGRLRSASAELERIPDGERFDHLTVLHILGIQRIAARFERGGDNQRIIDAISDRTEVLWRPTPLRSASDAARPTKLLENRSQLIFLRSLPQNPLQ